MTSTPTRIDPARDARLDVFGLLARFAPLIFLAILMAVFATLQPRFLSTINLLNVLRQVSISGLLAIGMTFVILTAGIDLSVGSLLALCGIAAAIVAAALTWMVVNGTGEESADQSGTPPTNGECSSNAPVKGNVSESGEKIFHEPGWEFYSRTSAEVCFDNAGEAGAAGYRASERQ